jgi:hypothetical protein
MTRTGKEKEGAEGVLGQEVDWAGLGRLGLKKKGRRRGKLGQRGGEAQGRVSWLGFWLKE